MQNMTVRLDAFEGPLDLLFHLIEKHEIDIYDIPILTITDQYINFLNNAEYKSMDSMSSFLLMAANLLEIKSKMLLPLQKPESDEGIDPREELVLKLIEYKKFKEITQEFKERQEKAAFLFYKENDIDIKAFKDEAEENFGEFLDGITFEHIFKAFQEVIKRKELKIDRVRSNFKAVERDLFTVEEKINYIKDLLILSPKVKFSMIFREEAEKIEIVVTFLALLELIKMKMVFIQQESIFDDIIIMSCGSGKNENYRAGSYN